MNSLLRSQRLMRPAFRWNDSAALLINPTGIHFARAPRTVPSAVRSRLLVSPQFKASYRSVGGGGGRHQYQRFPNTSEPWHGRWQKAKVGKLAAAGMAVAGTVYVCNLEVVPVSGRRRFNLVSVATEAQLAKQMYRETVHQFDGAILPHSHRAARLVNRVLHRLIPVSGLDDLNWEVFVIRDDLVKNAFVIPGGKVFVFSGILPICGDEDGLAAVLAHEIAHTVAHHSAERLSKSILVVGALLAVALAFGDVGPLGRVLLDLVYLRPGSRKQEAEADYIGLMIMAQACYNPEKAVTLWQRMEKAQQLAPPEFLSTHPSNVTRIENIKSWMPEAKTKQQLSNCEGDMLNYADEFREKFHLVHW